MRNLGGQQEPPPEDLFPAVPTVDVNKDPVDDVTDEAADAEATAELGDRAPRRISGRRRGVIALAAVCLLGGALGGYAVAGGGKTLADGQAARPSGAAAPSTAPVLPGRVNVSDIGAYLSSSYLSMGQDREHLVFSPSPELPSELSSAPAWAFDQASVITESRISVVASALGVKGEPRVEEGSWSVGYHNVVDSTLRVAVDGSAGMSFDNPRLDSTPCRSTMAEIDLCATNADPAAIEKALTELLSDVLFEIGVDAADLTFQLQDTETASTRSLIAEVPVGGRGSGMHWTATMFGSELRALDGPLAPAVQIASLPLVTVPEAVQRLNDPRFVPDLDVPVEGIGMPDPAAAPTVPALSVDATTLPWPVRQVEVVAAEPAYTLLNQPDANSILIPSYRLVDGAGASWTVVAVDDSALDFG